MSAPELRSRRLLLRHWLPEDRELFAAINADPQVMEHLPETLSPDQSDLFAETIQLGLEERMYGLWAVEVRDDKKAFIGFVGLSMPTLASGLSSCMQLGWRLSRGYWGFGYATEAAAKVMEYGFEVLELSEVAAITPLSNLRSMAVPQRLRMERHENFDHPAFSMTDPLRPHALFCMSHRRWMEQRQLSTIR